MLEDRLEILKLAVMERVNANGALSSVISLDIALIRRKKLTGNFHLVSQSF